MERVVGRFALLVFALLFVTSAFAQSGNDTIKKRTFYHNEDIETHYDKKKDETRVEIRRMLVPVRNFIDKPVLNINVYFTYPGKTPSRPESIVLGFISTSDGGARWFQDYRELTATVDNQKLPLGTPELLEAKMLARNFKEVLAMYLPFETLLRIVNTKKERVEMLLGRIKFELKKEHLEALRDFASRIK